MAEYIITAVAMITVAIIEALAAIDRRKTKRKVEQAETRAADRAKLMTLVIRGNVASIALGEAMAHAMQRGHTNGDMERALVYATDVKHRIRDFLSEQGVHDLLEE